MMREMQRAARRKNRTLSELVRENFRRSQELPRLDVYQFIRQIAPPPPELVAMREGAKSTGTDRLTMVQIGREVTAVRRQRDKKKGAKSKPKSRR
jgi:hypothetical protein